MDVMIETLLDVQHMALCAWREARGEGRLGIRAVCHVIMNRVRRPSWWGTNVEEVVYRKWQFSSMTDPKDPQTRLYPSPLDKGGWILYETCVEEAWQAYIGSTLHPAPGADHYYATYIATPKWADEKRFVKQIGNHRFYDLDREPPGEPPAV